MKFPVSSAKYSAQPFLIRQRAAVRHQPGMATAQNAVVNVPVAAEPDQVAQPGIRRSGGRLPLSLEANQEQADKQARSLSHGPGGSNNDPVSTDQFTTRLLTLRGGRSVVKQLNRGYAAAQFSLLTEGNNITALSSPLELPGQSFCRSHGQPQDSALAAETQRPLKKNSAGHEMFCLPDPYTSEKAKKQNPDT